MQSTIAAARNEGESSPIQSISKQISSIAQGTKFDIENFKLSTSKVENGVSFEFEFRATIRFPEKGSQ
jgi:hypothetical protein